MHKCNVLPNTVPVVQKQRPIPFALQSLVQTEIDKLLSADIIEKVEHSSWVSPVVTARKPGGGLRLCVDLRAVNKCIEPVKYPLPNIESLFASVHDVSYITKLDMKSAYHQLELFPDTRELTTFVVPGGLYRYKRAPFGLADLPGSFQHMMDSICQDLPGTLCYLDDIIVMGSTSEEHDKRLTKVLEKFSRFGITLNREKCIYKVQSLDWLGATISKDGVQMSQKNIEAITKLKVPSNISELRSVLGLFQHYSKYIPDFTSIVEPLRYLTRDNVPFKWKKSQQQAFEKAKSLLTKPSVLAFFRPDLETIVTCDASGKGVGAELSQIQPDGNIRPVAFASRTLHDHEKRYSVGELETLACIFAVEKWDRYLAGRHFYLYTDHQSLTTLLDKPANHGAKPLRISRWCAKLLRYNYTIKYKKGDANHVADTLSRMPMNPQPDCAQSDLENEAAIHAILNEKLSHDIQSSISMAELAKATKEDAVLSQVLKYVQNNWNISKNNVPETLLPFYRIRNELFIWNDTCLGRGERAIIPESMQSKIIELAHNSAHMGIVRLKQKLRQSIYWPSIDKDAEMCVKNCTACANSDKTYKTETTPLKVRQFPKGPWLDLGIDIMGPFKHAPRGFEYLVVVTDYYSKWPEVLATDIITTKVITEFLKSKFAIWGLPQTITSDNGPQFVSEDFNNFLKENEIEHILTPVYHPQGNGATERLNKTIKQLLQANLLAGKSWTDALRDVLVSFRSTPHATTKCTPFYLMTGREMRDRLMLLKPPSGNISKNNIDQTIVKSVLQEVVIKNQNKMCQYYDARNRVKVHKIKIGDLVRVKLHSSAHKLARAYSEPQKVICVKNDICTLENGKRWHSNRLVVSGKAKGALPEDYFVPQDDLTVSPHESPRVRRYPIRSTRGQLPAKYKDYEIG